MIHFSLPNIKFLSTNHTSLQFSMTPLDLAEWYRKSQLSFNAEPEDRTLLGRYSKVIRVLKDHGGRNNVNLDSIPLMNRDEVQRPLRRHRAARGGTSSFVVDDTVSEVSTTGSIVTGTDTSGVPWGTRVEDSSPFVGGEDKSAAYFEQGSSYRK